MNPGDLFIKLAMIAVVASGVLLLPSLRNRKAPTAALVLFGAQALALVAALVLLWSYFLGHDFRYAYVAQYSSRALSPALTFAASWAGQEGSVLLWAALGGVLGLALLRQPGSLARPALALVCLNQAFLILLLLVRSPFVRNPIVPADGKGLNPLLEDPWMVTHPPVLFIGYAAMLIPFALAGAALARDEYRDWNRMVWPWTLFAVVTLGTGIALGGIWAYKTLGWGGYWGWDPVENASLIPWLVAVALLHGLFIQRTTGAVARTNLLLALLGWVTVIGGTYLTRSGILQDFSVHSFADAGLNTPLVTFLAVGFALGAGLLMLRWRTVPQAEANFLGVSREAALWLGLVTVLVLAALVAFGTTAPLITGLAGKPASVQTRFYEIVSLPLGVALMLLIALAPALRWSRQQGLGWLSTLWPGIAIGVVAAGIARLSGMTVTSHLLLVFSSGAALAINAVMMVRLFTRGWSYGAGYLGHVGLAVAVVGMVVSSTLGRSEKLRLPIGVPVESALGYTLVYQGEEPDPTGQHKMKVQVSGHGIDVAARPRLFQPTQMEGTMRKPAILQRGELYLSPIEVLEGSASEPAWLVKDEPLETGGARYLFKGFRMSSHEDLVVYADVAVERNGRTDVVSPAIQAGAAGNRPLDAEVPGLGNLSIQKIDADHKRVSMMLPGAAAQVAAVELSTKPLINLVWVGALLTLLGSSLAGLRRAMERAPARKAVAVRPARQAVSGT